MMVLGRLMSQIVHNDMLWATSGRNIELEVVGKNIQLHESGIEELRAKRIHYI
jgi:hypothetical protein